MKKILYFSLLAAELFVGACLMISLWNSYLYIPIAIAAVAMIAMLTWMMILLAKATDSAAKQKIMLGIALSMLIPIVVFAITFIVIAVAFAIAFIVTNN